MKVLKLISVLCISLLILLPGLLSFLGKLEPSTMKTMMLIGTIVWFSITPFWIKEE